MGWDKHGHGGGKPAICVGEGKLFYRVSATLWWKRE